MSADVDRDFYTERGTYYALGTITIKWTLYTPEGNEIDCDLEVDECDLSNMVDEHVAELDREEDQRIEEEEEEQRIRDEELAAEIEEEEQIARERFERHSLL